MPSQVLGPGTLTVGTAPLDITAQVTNMRVEWAENVSEGETIPLLDGTDLKDEDTATYRATLAGNLVQDLTASGIVDWSWTNKGTSQAFEFIPNTVAARQVTGTVRVVPITIGGDAGKRNRSDISWSCPDDPVFGAVSP